MQQRRKRHREVAQRHDDAADDHRLAMTEKAIGERSRR